MQQPLLCPLNMAAYLELLRMPALKVWKGPCPACGAKSCAKFLCCYVRRRVYCRGQVFENVKIIRFVCQRLNPNVPEGTHRTFSLLPIFLIPYCPYTLDLLWRVAAELTAHSESPYRTTRALFSQSENGAESERLPNAATTIARIKERLKQTINKLHRLPPKLCRAIGWCKRTKKLSDLLAFINNYQSQFQSALSGVYALAYDWFYTFQQDRRYMQRDFLFGTPSQLCV